MSAASVAHALGGARKEGHGWRCQCPLHGGRSLMLSDGHGGRLLAWCFGGCDAREVLAELRHRGLFDGRGQDCAQSEAVTSRRDSAHAANRSMRALAIWRESRPAPGTIVTKYLESRGITAGALPAQLLQKLRYHSHCPHPTGAQLPAMVSLVEHVEHGPVAVHRTYLRPDGAGKACINPNKASLGPVGGGAVRFGPLVLSQSLAIAEGLETAVSVHQATGLPTWAGPSAGGIESLMLPSHPLATEVTIFADHDVNGRGQQAADKAAARWHAEGRQVRLALPPMPGADFNDVLQASEAAEGAA